ncbi:MAG: hypothetical protein FJX02_12860 [Alphaproteobacteria bacterium]|nr:hypothetical protein [Alphaproteobacteria bacterium]
MALRRLLLSVLFAVVAGAPFAAPAQSPFASPHGNVERRDPLFLRYAEMYDRYFEQTETMVAANKAIAIPMPRQCAFIYADEYARNQVSEREVQELALGRCQRRLQELGPIGENYGFECRCQLVVSNDRYLVPRSSLPDEAYGPASIFFRDDRGGMARLNGYARYGALIGRNRSVTFTVNNPRSEQACDGTLTTGGGASGEFSLSCFGGRLAARGTFQSKTGQPNDHIVARGQTQRNLPVVLVIGLPSQLAAGHYGGI